MIVLNCKVTVETFLNVYLNKLRRRYFLIAVLVALYLVNLAQFHFTKI